MMTPPDKNVLPDLFSQKSALERKKSSIDQISHFVNKALSVCTGSDLSATRQLLIAVLNSVSKIDGKLTSRSNTTQDFIDKAKQNAQKWNDLLVAGLSKKLLEMPKEESKEEDGKNLE